MSRDPASGGPGGLISRRFGPTTASDATRPRTPFINRRAGSPLYIRANSTHSAIATRAGVVAECSTSPMAVRSNARSILASCTTGYWGARRSINASIRSRFSTTASTRRRASSAVSGSPSSSARCRSSTAVAVRWPNSASKMAARASRRPARRARIRSPRARAEDSLMGFLRSASSRSSWLTDRMQGRTDLDAPPSMRRRHRSGQ